jgi:hypothetical protein
MRLYRDGLSKGSPQENASHVAFEIDSRVLSSLSDEGNSHPNKIFLGGPKSPTPQLHLDGPPRNVNKKVLAGIFGASLPSINNGIDKGMPVDVKGSVRRDYEFDTSEVLMWKIKASLSRDFDKGRTPT